MKGSEDDGRTRQLQGFEDVLYAGDESDEDEGADQRSAASRRTARPRAGHGDLWLKEDEEVRPRCLFAQ